MAVQDATDVAKEVPQVKPLFGAWQHMQLATTRGLRELPKTAYKLATGIRLGR